MLATMICLEGDFGLTCWSSKGVLEGSSTSSGRSSRETAASTFQVITHLLRQKTGRLEPKDPPQSHLQASDTKLDPF